MGRTLSPANMYILEAMTISKRPLKGAVKYVGVIRQNDDAQSKQQSKEHLIREFRDALMDQDSPADVVIGRLLTNDRHWQLVILKAPKNGEKPSLHIINSTQMAKKMSLEQIQEAYFRIIGDSVNSALKETGQEPIRQEEIEYIQGLQYGNMGCGFAADLNMDRLAAGELNKDAIFTAGDFQKVEGIEEIRVGDEVIVFPKTDMVLTKDRSIRNTRMEEATRRLELYEELYQRECLKNEIISKASS
ncbi:MAG: hypothetical protein HRU43_01195 [Simkaniaceae bacterium]|nr:hypothetical protein [Simkaniaceae bacterium]